MISVGVSSLVMVAVASIEYIGARMTKDVYGQTRSRGARMISLDQIRYRLMNARIASCAVTPDGRRIEYEDPTLAGNPTSALNFSTTDGTLYYDFNINDCIAAAAAGHGPIDVNFVVSNPALVTITATTTSNMGEELTDKLTMTTAVYLRNP